MSAGFSDDRSIYRDAVSVGTAPLDEGVSAPKPRSQAIRLLVTGFGPFPGMPRNPSAAVVALLQRHRAFFRRRGVDLSSRILPVRYDAVEAFAPAADVVVHVGVAGRRRALSVETVGRGLRSPRHPDASGLAPARLPKPPVREIDPAWRPRALAMALTRAGAAAAPSRDAGAYVCDALLHRALAPGRPPAIFIHIPRADRIAPARVALALARVLPDAILNLRLGLRREGAA